MNNVMIYYYVGNIHSDIKKFILHIKKFIYFILKKFICLKRNK